MRVLALVATVAVSFASTIKVDWVVPSGGVDENMQRINAHPGDTLRFEWSGSHNVFMLKKCNPTKNQKWDNFKCGNVQKAKGKVQTAKSMGYYSSKKYVEYKVPNKPGKSVCFICTVGNHCAGGQHSTVSIVEIPPPSLAVQHDVTWKNGLSGYDKEITVAEGDTIRFQYPPSHNIFTLRECPSDASADNPFTCDSATKNYPYASTDLSVYQASTTASPYVHTVEASAGTKLCFFCGVGDHCGYGWWMVANVTPAVTVNIDAVETKCKATQDTKICKMCGGKLKGGKCKVKAKKFGKLSCSKIRNDASGAFASDFCAEVGCDVSGGKCSGTLGKGL